MDDMTLRTVEPLYYKFWIWQTAAFGRMAWPGLADTRWVDELGIFLFLFQNEGFLFCGRVAASSCYRLLPGALCD